MEEVAAKSRRLSPRAPLPVRQQLPQLHERLPILIVAGIIVEDHKTADEACSDPEVPVQAGTEPLPDHLRIRRGVFYAMRTRGRLTTRAHRKNRVSFFGVCKGGIENVHVTPHRCLPRAR